jgi:hypothetical protein
MLVGYSVKLAMVLLLYIYMYRSNVARDAAAAGGAADPDREEDREAIENGMLDMTEIDNRGFRYIL